MTTVLVVIVGAVVVATVAGLLLTRRAGRVREIHSDPAGGPDAGELALSRSGPTIVHFSAPWCGPCDRVRRVVDQVCEDMADVAHLEVDLDADPATARRFSVLSLPTTLIFDIEGRQRYRAAGVPKAADLRSVLQPLLA